MSEGKGSFDDIHEGKAPPPVHWHHSRGQRECLTTKEQLENMIQQQPQPPQPFDYADDFDQVYDQTAKDVVNDMLDTIDVVDDMVDNVDRQEKAGDEDIDQPVKEVVDDMLDTIEVVDNLVDGVEPNELMDILDGEDEDEDDEEWPDVSTGQEKEEEFYEVNERRCLSCFGEEEPLEQCCGCEASSCLWHYQCVANMIISNEDRACTRCHYRYHHPNMERRIIRNPPETWRFFWRNLLEMPWFYGGLLFGILIMGINISHAISRKLHPTRNEERYAIWYATGLYFLVALIFLVRVALRSRRQETGFHDEIWFRYWPEPGVYRNNTRVYVITDTRYEPPYQQNLPV